MNRNLAIHSLATQLLANEEWLSEYDDTGMNDFWSCNFCGQYDADHYKNIPHDEQCPISLAHVVLGTESQPRG